MAKPFGPVLLIKYKDEKSLGTKITQGKLEIIKEVKTQDSVMKAIGDSWWYITELFNYVVNLFSGKATPEESPVGGEDGESEFIDTEIEEQFKVPYQQGRQELEAVADRIIEFHQENLSRPYPPSSRPGMFPAKRSGTLRKSISKKWKGPKVIQIGYKSLKGPTGDPLEYSQVLYNSPMNRLGLEQSAYQLKTEGLKTASNRELSWEFTDKFF